MCLLDIPHANFHLLGFHGDGAFGWRAGLVSYDLHRMHPWMSLWVAIVVGNLNMRSIKHSRVTNQLIFTLGR